MISVANTLLLLHSTQVMTTSYKMIMKISNIPIMWICKGLNVRYKSMLNLNAFDHESLKSTIYVNLEGQKWQLKSISIDMDSVLPNMMQTCIQ